MEFNVNSMCPRRARSDARGQGPRERRGIQIGPRIRIGGDVGKVLGKVQKVIQPSAGAMIGGGLGGAGGFSAGSLAGSAIEGRNLKDSFKTLVNDSLKGGAVAGGVLAAPAVGSAIAAGAGKAATLPIVSKLKSLVLGGGSDGEGNLGFLGDLAGKLGGGDGDGSSLLDKLLMGGSIAASAADRKKKQGLLDESVNYAKDPYDAKAPLRARALAGLEHQDTPNLSALFQDTGNVYDRQKRGMPALTTRAPAAAMMTTGQNMTNALTTRAPAPALRSFADSY